MTSLMKRWCVFVVATAAAWSSGRPVDLWAQTSVDLQKPPAGSMADAPRLTPVLEPGASKSDWQRRRAELKAEWTKFLGAFPESKVPLEPEFLEKEELPTFTRQRLTYNVESGVRTDAMLLVPKGATGKRPGIVLFHPTYQNHYARVVGLEGNDEPERQQAVQLVERGYVVLCPRCFIWADLPADAQPKPGQSSYVANVNLMQQRHPDWKGMTRMTWDGIRALDLMETLPDVDAERIGIFGHSLGAKEVIYVAAFDDRPKCVVSSEGGVGLTMSNWHDVWYLGPEIREPGFKREHHELLALIAPRPFLLLAGNSADSDKSWAFIEAALPAYRVLGAATHLGWFNHALGHRYGGAARPVAEAFLDQHLKGPAAPKAPAARGKAAAEDVSIEAHTDRPDAMYSRGQSATFTIQATRDGQPADGEVVCVLSKDGVQPRAPQTLQLRDGRATLTASLDEPGFLLLRASHGKASTLASAAFEPLQIKPSMPVPDDFDQFWDAQKKALAEVPAKSSLASVSSPTVGVDVFDVRVDCLGPPVSGYFARPQGAKPHSLPAILFVHGAGVGGSSIGTTSWAAQHGGMLTLDINAHGIANGQPAEFYQALSRGELKDYRSIGRTDRDKCYFKGMFLRLVRAIDFLTAQPEWDGETVIVYGSSQGGFQAFAAAGLDARVTFICAGVPAGCDHTGSAVGRVAGWPKFVPLDTDGKPDPAALETSRYFDCVNFATRARCKGAAVTVGFIDTTCPPTSVYAAYNALGVPKSLHIDVLAGHTNTPAATRFMQQAAARHIADR